MAAVPRGHESRVAAAQCGRLASAPVVGQRILGRAGPLAPLAAGLFVVAAGMAVAQVLSYALSLIAARILQPSDFGAFSALLGVFMIGGTVALGVQAVAARRIAAGAAAAGAGAGAHLVRSGQVLAALTGVVCLLISIPLAWLLSLPLLATMLVGLSLGVWTYGYVLIGIAQGRQHHRQTALALLLIGGGRALGGLIAVLLVPSVTSIALGLLLGITGGVIATWLIVHRGLGAPDPTARAMLTQTAHASHNLLALYALTNLDVLLARIVLTPAESGLYGVGVLMAKIAFFIPSSILIVFYPRMAGPQRQRIVLASAVLTLGIGAVLTAVVAIEGGLAAGFLGGPQYTDISSWLWLFSLAGTMFAVVQVAVYARLAIRDEKAVYVVWTAVAVLAVAALTLARDAPVVLVVCVNSVALALTVALALLSLRRSRREGEVRGDLAAEGAPPLA